LSNHQDLASIVEQFGIPFYWIPEIKKNKTEATSQQLNPLKKHHITSIVLARYMQILPEQLVQEYPNKIINIHHSFLLGFLVQNLITLPLKGELKLLVLLVIM